MSEEARALRWECWQRQVDELEALRAIFCIDGEHVACDEALLDTAQRVVEGMDMAGGLAVLDAFDAMPVSVYVRVQVRGRDDTAIVRARWGRTYPHALPDEMSVTVGTLSNDAHERLHAALREYMAPLCGQELMMDVVEWVRGAAGEHAGAVANVRAAPAASTGDVAMLVVLLKFHHIKASSKRRACVEWAREGELTGLCRPGTPGLVVVEGRREEVQRYCTRLRGLAWKKMSLVEEAEYVVAADVADVLGARRFPRMEETFCDNLMDLLPLFQLAGHTDMFYTGTKLPRR